MFVAVLTAALLIPAVAQKPVTFKASDCGTSSTHARFTTFTTDPASPTTGEKITVTCSGALDEQLTTGGQFEAKVKAAGVTLSDETGENCDQKTWDVKFLGQTIATVDYFGLSCPLAKGSSTLQYAMTLSNNVPPGIGNSKVSITAKDQNGADLLCVNMELDVGSGTMDVEPAITPALVDEINSKQTSWVAHMSPRFAGATLGDVKNHLGTILKGDPKYRNTLEEKTADNAWLPEEQIPSEFDVRTQWPKCASVSGDIRDQSACGSCWAFGSTEAFNDRRCIATGDTTLLSVEDTTANCGMLHCMSMGCNGGQPGMAWSWFASNGVVTGGDYTDIGKGDTCAPYSLAPCAHHVPPSSKYKACPSNEYPTPKLGSKCSESSYTKSYSADKKKASGSYNLGSVQKIQQDMLQYGSATAAFTVYADFPTYQSGVYHHTTGSPLGGHAVKILGWGTENGEDYWLVANSWNEQWGDHGTFKIKRGTNECGIEDDVSAGTGSSAAAIVV